MAAMMPGPGGGQSGSENPYNYDTPVEDDLIDPDDGIALRITLCTH